MHKSISYLSYRYKGNMAKQVGTVFPYNYNPITLQAYAFTVVFKMC